LSDAGARTLSKAKAIHIDGTFSVVPKLGQLKQLLCVVGRVGEIPIPAAWALMTHKRTGMLHTC